jgi:hypothetical protein
MRSSASSPVSDGASPARATVRPSTRISRERSSQQTPAGSTHSSLPISRAVWRRSSGQRVGGGQRGCIGTVVSLAQTARRHDVDAPLLLPPRTSSGSARAAWLLIGRSSHERRGHSTAADNRSRT